MNSQDQAFPGTSDTRTAEEVEQHIREANERLAVFKSPVEALAAISKHEADKVAQEPVAWRVGTTVYDDLNMARWSLRDAEHSYPIEELIVRPAPTNPATQEWAEPVVSAVGEVWTPMKDTRGYHALVQVIYELQQDGQYVDEEGEETNALRGLLHAIEDAARDPLELVADLLPGVYYMNPPDGGDVSLREQFERMAADASRWRALSATPPAPAQPSPESKPEQAEAPCCINWGAGTSCFADPKQDCPRLASLEKARPMESAPKDGTLLRLLVDFEDHATEDSAEPCWTIGGNSLDNTGVDLWQFVGWNWTHDCFTDGVGKAVGWLPMLATLPPAIAAGDSGAGERRPVHAKGVLTDRHGRIVPSTAYTQAEARAALATKPQAEQEAKSLNARVADQLRPFLKPGDKVIWREAFRWKDDDGVLSNHYDGMDLPQLAEEFGYDVLWDTNMHHAAIIRAASNSDPKGGV